jgi:dTDP-4-amino-4,6-dideoxygalactose transaminase
MNDKTKTPSGRNRANVISRAPRPFEKPICVTRPFLPPIEEFTAAMQEIWDSKWLTNNGPILQRFTRQLSGYFKTDNVCLFNNGTLALQIGLQGMGISGEVITTPFSFVATTHALYWNNIIPVFVDIEPEYYTLDPEKVEAAITPRTTAILAVHVFGYPCHVNALAAIAQRHDLKLIYDAAHAFGAKINGKSVAHFGDMSMFSFHATKPYHSLEGGMLTFQDSALKRTFNYLKNFGIKNEVEVVMPGTNAKMNELQALMGYLVLKHFDDIMEKNRDIATIYREQLGAIPGIHFPPPLPNDILYSNAYVAVEVDEEEFGMRRDELYEALKGYNVFARRYFYPLITDYACYKDIPVTDPLTAARRISSRILTLPIYNDLTFDEVNRVCDIISWLSSSRTKGPEFCC